MPSASLHNNSLATLRSTIGHCWLTGTELRLLLCLWDNRGRVVSYRVLNQEMLGDHAKESNNGAAIKVSIFRLRRKLGHRVEIVTIHRRGYMLV